MNQTGYKSGNNSWCIFENVRIPRTDMLMGLCNVTREGEFEIIGDMRVLYSSMMAIRMQFISELGSLITIQATRNAIRYCCVRRQFATHENSKEERKVIDYQTTSTTLAKLLARGRTDV